MKKIILLLLLGCWSFAGMAQKNYNNSKFRQLDELLPTPNNFRAGSGAPGHEYWQQKADYQIKVKLDEDKRQIIGSETITYTNQSPDPLKYLWLQLDQNMRAKDSDTYKTRTSQLSEKMSARQLKGLMGPEFDGGHKIQAVKDAEGDDLPYTINKTMMRVDMPRTLAHGESFTFSVDWYYNINNRMEIGGRSGYENFPEDGNDLFTIAQWFPRMAVYDDVNGWQHKQFLGRGEFALTFGDYKVEITVPADHIVASTGVLQNPEEVLTEKQRQLFQEAKTASDPVIIVSQKEVEKKEKKRESGTKTWVYQAENVRDFAWASSRKLIWDAMGVEIGGKTIMAMSYYPKEANPLYERYSTEAVAHTLRVYSKHTFDYPYPVAISVEAANGMEYPMICFNYGRPEKDGTYSERIKYGMIGVIIHEVGHNYFPMIVNSDERQWTWMDEGLNSFVQYLAQEEWERGFPSRRGPAEKMVPYMKGDKANIMPIMTNSESIPQFGNNAYGKPATALNILRETVMGRELFDYAFREYAQRWMFRHPAPADFFRTMEDASGMDLDWFWRGWFYTTDHVDISIDNVVAGDMLTGNPEVDKSEMMAERDGRNPDITTLRNKEAIEKTLMEQKPQLQDFYNEYDPLNVTPQDKEAYQRYVASLGEEEKALLSAGKHFYQLDFSNVGGLVMPLIVEMQFEDGTSAIERIPAEIWRMDSQQVSKVFVTDKPVQQFVLDPYRETADTDEENNYFPRKPLPSRFELFKRRQMARGSSSGTNPMQQAQQNGKKAKGADVGGK